MTFRTLVHMTYRTTAVALLAFMAGIRAGIAAEEAAASDTAELRNLMLEEIVVTGSLLKRELGDVAQPMTVLEADELVRLGATNPEQIMQQIAQNQPISVSNVSIGRATAGSSYANLRSLGSERTLVLVNGKRVVNSPYQSIGVDLNTVPTSLVERVEILADGGSSTYGTDAVAGVVNFITAKELTGLNASMTAITPEKTGGGQNYLAGFSGGVGSIADDGWNLYAGAKWRKAEELRNIAREFSSTGFVPDRGIISQVQNRPPSANYSQADAGITDEVNPANPQCAGAYMLFAGGVFGPRSCAYDVVARLDLITPQEQWSAFGKGSLRLGQNHTVSLEYIRGDNRLTSFASPQSPGGINMPSSNPYFPGQGITPGVAGIDPLLPIQVNWRTEELGRRQSEIRGFTDRALAQLEGRLGAWDYQVSALISTSHVDVILIDGYPDEGAVRDGFTGDDGAPFLNPFGPQTPAGLQYLQSTVVRGTAQTTQGELDVYGAQLSRELVKLAGGSAALAAAIEIKSESARFTNDTAVTSRIPTTFAEAQDITGERDSYSASIEVDLPVLEHLDVGLAARYDHYDGFGSTTNPELSLRYEPLDWLVLRGSYSTSFRAPTLYNVFQPRTLSYTFDAHDDPVLCPEGVLAPGGISARDCTQMFQTNVGGNPNLDAEDSDAHSLGFLLKPVRSLAIGVDYWSYHLERTIGPPSEQAIFADPAKHAADIIRCSQLPAAARARYDNCTFGGGDPIAYVEDVLDNLGDTRTSGFDLTASWTGPQGTLGQFGVEYRGTYVSKYEFQREPGGAFFNRAGRYFDESAVLRYMHFLSASWQRGAWTTQLTHRYRAGYADCNDQCGVEPEFFNDVRAFSTFDLSGAYQWHNVTFAGTIGNLFNEAPPFTNGSSGLSTNWDDRYADPRLRTYLLTVSWKL